jgi:hypothetical protein
MMCLKLGCHRLHNLCKGYQKMSVDDISDKLKASGMCQLNRDNRRKAIKLTLQKEKAGVSKKTLKSLKVGMQQANEGKVVKKDFSEFAPKKKSKMTIDQEVAYLRKKGWDGSREQLRAEVKLRRTYR